MKKLFALVTTLLLSLSAHAAQFSEGEHYKVLDLEASKKPTVTEFFSFYCPHCKTFDPIIRQLKAQLPEGVKLNKAHVSLMGGAMGKELNNNGFTVDSMARRYDKQFQDAGLTGVPAVVVNNKYLVQAQSIESLDQYFALVNYLTTLK